MHKGGSKLLWKWEKEKEQSMHLSKLQEIKNRSAPNSGFLPEIHSSVVEAAQRQQHFAYVQIQRQIEIEKQNEMHVRRLLRIQAASKGRGLQAAKGMNQHVMKESHSNKHISFIEQNKEEMNNNSYAGNNDSEQQGQQQLQQSSFIHNRTDTNNFSQTSSVMNHNNKSKQLNGSSRKSSYQALVEQRQTLAFFRRINETKSVFDAKKWSKQATEHSKALMVCSKFTPDSTVGGVAAPSAARHSRSSEEIRIPHSLGTSTTSMNRESQYQHDRSFNKTASVSLGSTNLSLGRLGNVTLPCDFMMTQSSDSQKMHYIKKVLGQKKQVLYRKTAEIEGEQFFAEIRIENSNFYIDLENAQGMVFSHNLPQAEGSLFFERECNGEFEQLFRKISLDRSSKRIHLRQSKPLYKDSQLSMTASHSKSNSQTKYATSRSAIYQADGYSESDKGNNDNNSSTLGHINNEAKRNARIGKQQAQQAASKTKQVQITNKAFPPANKQSKEQVKKQVKVQQTQVGTVKVVAADRNSNAKLLQKQQQAAVVKNQANNGDKTANNKQDNQKLLHAKEEQQQKQSQSSVAPKQTGTSNKTSSQGINKPTTKKEPVQLQKSVSSEEYDEEYEDPFEKFDEEDRKKQEEERLNAEVHNETSGVTGAKNNHHQHPHELADKKMSSFSFQQTTQYKRKGETEQVAEKGKLNNQEQQNHERELADNQEQEEENYEFEEESDGTQYEINDEDKVNIQNKNKEAERNGNGKEKEQKEDAEEEQVEQEEEYADEFE